MGSITDEAMNIADALDVSKERRLMAVEMARRAERAAKYNNKDPAGVAAACVYAAGLAVGEGKNPTQTQAAEAAGVTEATVRNTYGDLLADHSRARSGEERTKRAGVCQRCGGGEDVRTVRHGDDAADLCKRCFLTVPKVVANDEG